MNKLSKVLVENLGFTDKKACVYLALLSLGETDASTIAKRAGLKRTTVYNILPELLSEGFIKSTISQGLKKFFVDDPQSVHDRAFEKAETIAGIVPQLISLQDFTANKPTVKVYDGIGGFKEIYKDFLSIVPPGGIVRAYFGSDNNLQYLSEDIFEHYIKKRVAKKIRVRLIAGRSPLLARLGHESVEELREVKITDSPDFHFIGETIIYDNKVAFISYKENFLGVVIESKEIALMQRASFDLLWDRL